MNSQMRKQQEIKYHAQEKHKAAQPGSILQAAGCETTPENMKAQAYRILEAIGKLQKELADQGYNPR